MARTKKVRMSVWLPGDLDNELRKYSDKFEISKAVLIQMSIRSGLDSIIRAISPVDALSASQWALISSEMMKIEKTIESKEKIEKNVSEPTPD